MIAGVQSYISAFFETAKSLWRDFDIKKWAESIGGSAAEAVIATVYFALSFAIGFLCKRYFRYILICCIFTIFTIKGLEYITVISIDWRVVRYIMNMVTGGNFFATLFVWIKSHLLLFIATTVGFLVGYKLG